MYNNTAYLIGTIYDQGVYLINVLKYSIDDLFIEYDKQKNEQMLEQDLKDMDINMDNTTFLNLSQSTYF